MELIDPPRWTNWLVRKFCPPEHLEEMQGDLEEAFYWRQETQGISYARRRYVLDSLKTIRLYKFKKSEMMKSSRLHLLTNYFKTGLRFLWKTRSYSLVNIFGLALGIASAALAFLFLLDQFAYDQHHQYAHRLYRLGETLEFQGNVETMGGSSYVMGEALPHQVPGIEKASRIKSGFGRLQLGQEVQFQGLHYADPALFEMLDFSFIEGGPGAFTAPNQVVVSESFAAGLPDRNGFKLLMGEQSHLFTIVGIFRDFPKASTLQPEILVPFTFWKARVPARRLVNWFDINMNLFILKEGSADVATIEEKMNEVLAANYDTSAGKERLFLQPFGEMHTDQSIGLGNGLLPSVDLQVLWVVFVIGLLCLLISCFNYSNFAVGNLLTRTREVAMRKVMGANRFSIFQQFLTESALSTLVAALLSLVFIHFFLPFFSSFVNEAYSWNRLLDVRFLIGFMITITLSALLSGVYPAIALSAKGTSRALKDNGRLGGKAFFSWFLVMIQVSLAIFLIIGMITTNRQLDHLISFDLGYDDDRVITTDLFIGDEQKIEQIKDRLARLPEIAMVSVNSGYNGTVYEDGPIKMEVGHLRVDEQFFSLLDIPFLQGRNFNEEIATDRQQSVIVNKTFVQMANLSEPVGQKIPFQYGELKDPTIIAVVDDYHFLSPKTAMTPLVIYTSPEYVLQNLLIKPAPGFTPQTIRKIEDIWREVYPQMPFSYSWLDEINRNQMAREIQLSRFSLLGSGIAILLASLGLFGMVGTHVRQRMKEVSIRKINGAGPLDIYLLFLQKFGRWLLLGFLFGALPAWYLLSRWLQGYPERIELAPNIPILAVLICSTVFAVIISILMIRVIRLNPVAHLRDE